tara:strand:+ start:187 stop:495 length:309 start_codon:yes stop_codon:yes gene_type:complete
MVTVNGNIPINELLENTDLQKIPEIELSSLRENIDITNPTQKVRTFVSLGHAIGELIHRDWFSFFMLEISFDKIGIDLKIAFTIGHQCRLFALHLLKRIVQS